MEQENKITIKEESYMASVWKEFSKNRSAVAGCVILILISQKILRERLGVLG